MRRMWLSVCLVVVAYASMAQLNRVSVSQITGTLPTTQGGTGLTSVGSAGQLVRSNGSAFALSTATYPDTATTGDLVVATGTNALGSVAAVATGQVLTSAGTGTAPAYSATPTVTSVTTTAGTGTATGTSAITIRADVTATGSVTSGESDLITWTMPANTLSANGQSLLVKSCWTTAANTNSKTGRTYFNGTVLLAQTTTASGEVICHEAVVLRTSTSAATYTGYSVAVNAGIARVGPATLSSQTWTGTIIIKITGQAATSNNDITSNYLKVVWFP